jgi:hypothetical protein
MPAPLDTLKLSNSSPNRLTILVAAGPIHGVPLINTHDIPEAGAPTRSVTS